MHSPWFFKPNCSQPLSRHWPRVVGARAIDHRDVTWGFESLIERFPGWVRKRQSLTLDRRVGLPAPEEHVGLAVDHGHELILRTGVERRFEDERVVAEGDVRRVPAHVEAG